ncbi:MAG: metallophosphoesterase [Terracidiphilus sp.]
MSNWIKNILVPFALAFLTLWFAPIAWSQAQPWFFAVLADPQMGMFAHDQNFAQETANLEFVVANLNRLRPRFVVICGDLVNRTGDAAQTDEYKRILKELDPTIPLYNVAGNHDVGNIPTPATLAAYRTAFGPDYYTFNAPGILGVVLDSNLIRSPQGAPQAAQLQKDWLDKTLASARADRDHQVVVFQHIPFFIYNADEADEYFNIPQPARQQYLNLLEKAGVRNVFAGHYHRNAIGSDGPLTEIVTGAVGKPLGQSVSGFRLVRVEGTKLESTWYCLGKIPNTIDVQKPLPETCPQ